MGIKVRLAKVRAVRQKKQAMGMSGPSFLAKGAVGACLSLKILFWDKRHN
jgi:hypothetical protein